MPQDPDLYGQRAAKKKTGAMDLSGTLGFSAQLQSIISAKSRTGGATASRKRARDDDDTAPNAKHSTKPAKARSQWIKGPAPKPGADAPLDARERERIRTNMEAKAKRYAAMQRGDYLGKDGEASSLVDFDRKWAERQDARRHGGVSSDRSDGDSDGDSDSDKNGHETVEYVDDFGRTRTVSKAQRERDLAKEARAKKAAAELDELRARPTLAADAHLIHGNFVQTHAIETVLDRPPQPPQPPTDDAPVQDTHYRADDDVRTRGAAFYAFATDDETQRQAQMDALAAERAQTEAARAEAERARADRSAQLEARRKEIAARRAALGEKRAKKQADDFLDNLVL